MAQDLTVLANAPRARLEQTHDDRDKHDGAGQLARAVGRPAARLRLVRRTRDDGGRRRARDGGDGAGLKGRAGVGREGRVDDDGGRDAVAARLALALGVRGVDGGRALLGGGKRVVREGLDPGELDGGDGHLAGGKRGDSGRGQRVPEVGDDDCDDGASTGGERVADVCLDDGTWVAGDGGIRRSLGDGKAGLDVGDGRRVAGDGDIGKTAGVGGIRLDVGHRARLARDGNDGRAGQVSLVLGDGGWVTGDSDKAVSRGLGQRADGHSDDGGVSLSHDSGGALRFLGGAERGQDNTTEAVQGAELRLGPGETFAVSISLVNSPPTQKITLTRSGS